MTCQPIFDRHGNVESVFEASVDMTEHYQQQLALENSRNKLLASNEQLRLYIEQDKAVSACLESLLFYSDFKDALRHVLANIGRTPVLCFVPEMSVVPASPRSKTGAGRRIRQSGGA